MSYSADKCEHCSSTCTCVDQRKLFEEIRRDGPSPGFYSERGFSRFYLGG